MPTISEELQIPQKTLTETSRGFWWCLTFLLLAVILLHGKTVPFSNEFIYLLRLEPGFLPNDWTFASPANEHWLFNFIFSFPARIFPLEIVGWLGRFAVWILCLTALIKIAGRWTIPFWAIGISIFLWLCFAQSVVNDEWIFGGFEAKTAAYVCLLFSLNEFCRGKIIAPSVLLGSAFSFHPAVGLWAIAAVGLIFFFEIKRDEKQDNSAVRVSYSAFLKVVGVTFVFSLFGLIPLLFEQSNQAANLFDDWRYVVLYRVPWHLDLFQFSPGGIVLIFLMLAFNCFASWKSESFAVWFLLKFQIWLGVFFAFGLLLRWFELYPLLRFMPMRLFPIFTPLFFIFTAFYFVPRINSAKYKIAAAAFAVVIVAALNPLGKGSDQVRETLRTWQSVPDDLQIVSRWMAANTPTDALVIQPPHNRSLWYYSRRAAVASFAYPTYDRLGKWRGRINDLTGNRQILKGETASDEIEAAFNELSAEQIEGLKNKYAATHLVSRAEYSYPVIYQTETYKVYQLR